MGFYCIIVNYIISLSLNFLNQWETDCVRFPGVQFKFKLHSTQDLIGIFNGQCVASVGARYREDEEKGQKGREGGKGRGEKGGERLEGQEKSRRRKKGGKRGREKRRELPREEQINS